MKKETEKNSNYFSCKLLPKDKLKKKEKNERVREKIIGDIYAGRHGISFTECEMKRELATNKLYKLTSDAKLPTWWNKFCLSVRFHLEYYNQIRQIVFKLIYQIF